VKEKLSTDLPTGLKKCMKMLLLAMEMLMEALVFAKIEPSKQKDQQYNKSTKV
jgi:hypothetical protein